MTTPHEHLTLDELDALRSGDGTAAQTAHRDACTACQSASADVAVIAAALAVPQASLAIPKAVDDRILWLARKQAAAIKRSARSAPSVRWAIAAGVILALGAAGLWRSLSSPSFQVARAPGIVGDVNGDGHLDILDAFALARTIETDAAAGTQWDLDGDGTVDGRDVDRIAQSVVALGKS